MPLAISLVGASVIWGFVYAWQPAGQPQGVIKDYLAWIAGPDAQQIVAQLGFVPVLQP